MAANQALMKRLDGPSKVIAIAGASGSLGKHVTEELLRAGYKVVIISRKKDAALISLLSTVSPDASKLISSIAIDYATGLEDLTKAFNEHDVDTVMSCLFSVDYDAIVTAQQVLLDASVASKTVRRFVPGDWAFGIECAENPALYASKVPVMNPLRASPLNWTLFSIGLFTNYFGSGSPLGPERSTGYIRNIPFVVDVKNASAVIPGDGNQKILFTEIHDVGKLVAAACALPVWEETTGKVAGDIKTYNEVVEIAEEVTGKKFSKTYISLESFKERAIEFREKGDQFNLFYTEVMAMFAAGAHLFEPRLVGILQEHGLIGEGKIAQYPKTVKECLIEWWSSSGN